MSAEHGTPSRPPLPPTAILGRAVEVAAVTALLRRDGVRLVTLVGPGGIGKTRLALEVARGFDAAGYVDLAAVGDAGQVPGAVAAALGGRPDQPVDRLRDGPPLLVLDNVGQVLPDVAALLAAGVRVLATRRTALRLPGEHEVPLGPLAPGPAVELLLDRGRQARPGFAPDLAGTIALERLAGGLGGNPRALELAAARLRLLSPVQLLARLTDRREHPLDPAAGPVDAPPGGGAAGGGEPG